MEALRDLGADITSAGGQALVCLLVREDGWLRIVPHDHGQLVYFKWKFSKGKHAGHYVMYRCDDMGYSEAFIGLERKLLLVDAGLHRPTLDKPYDD